MEETKESFDDLGNSIPPTTFEEPELLTEKELAEVMKMMPYAVRKSVKLAKKGLLPQITSSELKERLETYFDSQNIHHVQRSHKSCEPSGEVSVGGTRKREDSL